MKAPKSENNRKKKKEHPMKNHKNYQRYFIGWDMFESYTQLTQILVILEETEKNNLVMSPTPCKNKAPMGTDTDYYCWHHRVNVCHTDDYKILKRHIEALIQRPLLKYYVTFKIDKISNPMPRERRSSPKMECVKMMKLPCRRRE